MASSGRWPSPHERHHISSAFPNEHPGRSHTSGRHRSATVTSSTKYPRDYSVEPSPNHSGPYRSRSHHNRPRTHTSSRYGEADSYNHPDSVSLNRSRTRYPYDQENERSNHSSRRISNSENLANSRVSDRNDRHRDRDWDRDRYREMDRDRNRERTPDRDHSQRIPSATRQGRHHMRSGYDDNSSDQYPEGREYSNHSGNSNTSRSNDWSRRDRYDSPKDRRSRYDRTSGKNAKSRQKSKLGPGPVLNPLDISSVAKFVLIASVVCSLTGYVLIIMVGRDGWRFFNFWVELLLYIFVLTCMVLYAFNIRAVVDFLSENLPIASSLKGCALVLTFVSVRTWPRSWPANVNNRIEAYIAGNVLSLAGLITSVVLYFIE